MDRLWTPWRMTYVTAGAHDGCVFCTARDSDDDVTMLILHRGTHCYVILNLYPYNSGHMMIVPYEHAASIEDVDSATRAEMFELSSLAVEVARSVLRCSGFNLGMNLGEHAGAGVAHHIHLHVVPRWVGDANFMPIVGQTMVMPELLPVTYARLRAGFEGLHATRRDGAILQAGAVVYLPDRDSVVLRRGRRGDIVLPKGHIECGETSAEAAIREVREETGIDATIVGWAGSTTYTTDVDGDPSLHHVVLYLATGTPTAEMQAHLNTDTLLVPSREAAGLIDIPDLQQIVRMSLSRLQSLQSQR